MVLATMPRPKSNTPRKVAITCKVAPEVAKQVEEIADEMTRDRSPATVTVSQLVEFAIVEFIKQHRKSKK